MRWFRRREMTEEHEGVAPESAARAGPRAAEPDWRTYDGVAETYDRVRAPLHAAVARDLIELVAPDPAARVLDVGTGTGVAAEAARAAVGPEGLVVGIDPSLPMLRRALRRNAGPMMGAEAIDLPFRDGAFDAVVATFVIAFFTKYETALFDIRRVLRPEGTIGVSAWTGPPDEFRKVWSEVAESFASREMLRDAFRKVAPWEEHFSDPRRLKDTLREAGFRKLRVERRAYRFTASHADYLAGRETSAYGRFLRHILGEKLWPRFQERVAEAFRTRFADPLGDTSDVLLARGTNE